MIEVVEYKLVFKYNKIDNYVWSDNFILSEEWEILRLKGHRIIQKSYMGRSPYTEPKNDYIIALYSQNKWYCLKDGVGEVTSPIKEKPNIPNLDITSCEFEPHLSVYKFEFDFHIMMTLLNQKEDVKILEFKRISLTEGLFIYNKMKINIYGSLLSYKGDRYKEFIDFCDLLQKEYINEKSILLMLFSKLDKEAINPNETHKSIAYKTWYKAKRENQNEWPHISKTRLKNSIEFPKDSNIWYYYPNKYVGLAKRNDDNPDQLIPKIYEKDHSILENTHLYFYIHYNKPNDTNKVTIPHTLRNEELKNVKVKKKLGNEKYVDISHDGKIIEMDQKPSVYVYKNMIIKDAKIKERIKLDAQLLNENNERSMILYKGEWSLSVGPRIRNVITIPWYYRQIIHDYNKLGRLKEGNIMDLTSIGIVNPDEEDIITWPNIENLYQSKTLETHRLITFKYQKYVNIDVIYD